MERPQGETHEMPVEIAGFAEALARCLDFESVEPGELEDVLSDASEPLEMRYCSPSADSPLIRSGSPFTHLALRPERHHRAVAVPALGAHGAVPGGRARIPDKN